MDANLGVVLWLGALAALGYGLLSMGQRIRHILARTLTWLILLLAVGLAFAFIGYFGSLAIFIAGVLLASFAVLLAIISVLIAGVIGLVTAFGTRSPSTAHDHEAGRAYPVPAAYGPATPSFDALNEKPETQRPGIGEPHGLGLLAGPSGSIGMPCDGWLGGWVAVAATMTPATADIAGSTHSPANPVEDGSDAGELPSVAAPTEGVEPMPQTRTLTL